jgi:mRNA-degrading endonuclease RelE of RelBE toxin-antitoxin system
MKFMKFRGYKTSPNPCGKCRRFKRKQLLNCSKYRVRVGSAMRVVYPIKDGPCWEQRKKITK